MVTKLINGFIAVEIHPGAHRFYSNKGIYADYLAMDIHERKGKISSFWAHREPLPEGDWEKVAIWPEITEEEAMGLIPEIDDDPGFYPNYNAKNFREVYAREALQTLLESKKLDPEKRYYILKPHK